MRILSAVLTLAVAIAVLAAVHAAEKSKAGDQVGALGERIQDLNITDEQEARIADITKEFRPKNRDAARQLAAVVKEEVENARAVLTPEQRELLGTLKEKRKAFREKCLGQRMAHLGHLDLTDAEQAKIDEIRSEYRPKIAKAMKELEGQLSDEQRKARQEALKAGKNRKEVWAAVNLTDAQKEKVEAVCKDVGTLVRQEMEKIRDVLTAEQQEKLQDLKDERAERVRDRTAFRIANLKDLNLTDEQKTKIADIRREYRPRIHEAGNKLRASVRDELGMILGVLKG